MFTYGKEPTPYMQRKKGSILLYQTFAFLMVRETGLEPVHQRYTPLKRARLPIPPLPQALYYYKALWRICQVLFVKKFVFFSFILRFAFFPYGAS